MDSITFVTVGCGYRGTSLTKDVLIHLDDVKVIGVCDFYTDKAEALADCIVEKGFERPAVSSDYRTMLTGLKPDAVYVATSWEYHTDVAVFAMEHGIAVAMEVGGAMSEGECRQLVNAYEHTKTPFMFMENCCFGKAELLSTSLVRNGKFGDVVYCHGAYGHDLRAELARGDEKRHYRLHHYMERNCENYPTHELGPIARILGIGRGNRLVSLVSRSSRAAGLNAYMQERPEYAYKKDRVISQGDIVETLITCENGELISMRLDTTLPRLYSRELSVRGTKGMYNQDNNMVLLDGGFKESFDTPKAMGEHASSAEQYSAYLPMIWQNAEAEKLKRGHGGMDWFEFVAFMDALRNKKPMPIDVYDAATWMSIAYLSEKSIALGGVPVEIPDFTKGAYKTRALTDVVEIPTVKEETV